MNATLLRRMFTAVSRHPSEDARKVCASILEDERKKGHQKLATELEKILEKTAPAKPAGLQPLPAAQARGAHPMVLDTPRERLRHHMVLPSLVERRFARIEKEFAASNRLKLHGLRPKNRILLYGPPGCGKTLGAERLAWNTGLTLRRVRFETLISSYYGETAANLHTVFADAAKSPCALFLDECDTIATSRGARNDVGEVSRVVNTLLQLLEEYHGPGLVIAATNLTTQLDRALFRRFDEVIEVPLPEVKEIARLLEMTLSAIETDRNIPWFDLAHALDGHSCSEVVRVAENAAKHCILEGRKRVQRDDLDAAMTELNRVPLEDHA